MAAAEAEVQGDRVRCSTWARSVELSPIGTVGSYAGYVVVEVPLPWPRDIGEIGYLAPVAEAAAASGYRVQAVVPTSPEATPSERSIITYGRPAGDGWFDGCYLRQEAPAGDDPSHTVRSLLEKGAQGVAGPERCDVLVCTHGRRDVCCGSLGTDLALQLAALGAPNGVRYRRTSHTGGHRFAPTFLVLPQGTGWAFASEDLVDAVLQRSAPFAEVAPHYRGCAGLPGPAAQALEREVLIAEGWEIMDRPRRAFVTGEQTSSGKVWALEVRSGAPGGTVDRWEAVVGPGRTLPVPDCMKPLTDAKKTETEWTVGGLRRA